MAVRMCSEVHHKSSGSRIRRIFLSTGILAAAALAGRRPGV
jgi:hypothetical protein